MDGQLTQSPFTEVHGEDKTDGTTTWQMRGTGPTFAQAATIVCKHIIQLGLTTEETANLTIETEEWEVVGSQDRKARTDAPRDMTHQTSNPTGGMIGKSEEWDKLTDEEKAEMERAFSDSFDKDEETKENDMKDGGKDKEKEMGREESQPITGGRTR